jgi:hypothetical protein
LKSSLSNRLANDTKYLTAQPPDADARRHMTTEEVGLSFAHCLLIFQAPSTQYPASFFTHPQPLLGGELLRIAPSPHSHSHTFLTCPQPIKNIPGTTK